MATNFWGADGKMVKPDESQIKYSTIIEIKYSEKITRTGGYEGEMGWVPKKYTHPEEHTAIIFETKTGKFAPLSAYGDPGNYLYMARNFPDQVRPLEEFKTQKAALKSLLKGKKSVKILSEERRAF